MKTPIAMDAIRRGDLIRVEQVGDKAHEFRATMNGQRYGWGHYYLLDRPTPPVELPTEPMLGWLEFTRADGTKGGGLHRWVAITDDSVVVPYGHVDNASECVTAFTPAVAVPQSALEMLGANVDCSGPLSCLRGHVEAFLASVQEANA